jgi:acetyl-CoA C-acetyltransferase
MADKSRIPVIIAAARTPIGKFLGSLTAVSAPELGATAIRSALQRSGVPASEVEEVIMGNVVQGGVGQAPARQAMLKAGIPASVSAMTINKVCGSGLKAVMLAAQSIKAGDAQVIVAGGQESMSNAPHYVYGMRNGVKLGDQQMVDGMIKDGLWCASCDVHMGSHAEYTAKKAAITRAQQDEFAALSHMKAVAAQKTGKFKDEIAPVTIPGKKGGTVVDVDEGPRSDTTASVLAKLRPAFGKGDDATVTAGNASSLNDGGAAVVVTSQAYAEAHGLKILGRVTAYATGAVDPQELFFAPITAVNNLMKKEGKAIGDYDLIEANEAFASQALADGAGLNWDWDRVNVNGGAIALGHPLGATGARLVTMLVHELARTGGRYGLATMCIGVGQGIATVVERIEE